MLYSTEAVLVRESGVQEGKLGSSWDLGIWVGQIDLYRAIKARAVERRPETLKWDRKLYDAMNLMPWSMVRLQDRKLARNQHRDAKRAMKKEVKRRGRPFNHTPECNEKQADFRARLREMKMLPLDGT